MQLKELQDVIKEFDVKTGFEKTEFSTLLDMLEEETKILRSNPDNSAVVSHQLTDILILIMQVAHRYDTDFEKEVSRWFDKSMKYLR